MSLITTLVLAHLATAVPDQTIEKWLDRTRQLESSGRCSAIGDGGRSRGPYQIQEATWRQFGGRGPWRIGAHQETESRKVARRYIRSAVAECHRRGWPADFAHVRHLYRYGLNTTARP